MDSCQQQLVVLDRIQMVYGRLDTDGLWHRIQLVYGRPDTDGLWQTRYRWSVTKDTAGLWQTRYSWSVTQNTAGLWQTRYSWSVTQDTAGLWQTKHRWSVTKDTAGLWQTRYSWSVTQDTPGPWHTGYSWSLTYRIQLVLDKDRTDSIHNNMWRFCSICFFGIRQFATISRPDGWHFDKQQRWTPCCWMDVLIVRWYTVQCCFMEIRFISLCSYIIFYSTESVYM